MWRKADDQDSRSPRTGSSPFDGGYGQGSEVVADRLRQPRLIHLPFHARDNLSFNLDPAFLFHIRRRAVLAPNLRKMSIEWMLFEPLMFQTSIFAEFLRVHFAVGLNVMLGGMLGVLGGVNGVTMS